MRNSANTRLLASWIVAIALAFFSAGLFAHTGLEASVPAANAHLDEAPAELRLTFASDVRLMRVSVLDDQGKEQPLDFNPSAQATKNFAVSLPELPSSTYTVHWVSMGGDGHKMSGDFSFMVGGTGHTMTHSSDGHDSGPHH